MNVVVLGSPTSWYLRDLTRAAADAPPHHPRPRSGSCAAAVTADRATMLVGGSRPDESRRRDRAHDAAGLAGASRVSHGCARPIGGGGRRRSSIRHERSKRRWTSTWPPRDWQRPACAVPRTVVCQTADDALQALTRFGARCCAQAAVRFRRARHHEA